MFLTNNQAPTTAFNVEQQQQQQYQLLNNHIPTEQLFVDEPLPDDILCGKDKRCMTHKGSLFFKGLIDAHVVQYKEASSRQAKMEVTKTIFDMLQNSRFLKWNDETKQWEVLHPLSIRDKIGHALRFANRKSKASSAAKQSKARRTSSYSSSSSSSSDSGCTSCRSPSCDSSTCSSPASSLQLTALSIEIPPEVSFFSGLSLGQQSPITTNEQQQHQQFTAASAADSNGTNDLMWIMQLPLGVF